MKNKILKYEENSGYLPDAGFFSLGKIDKLLGTAENRLSNDETLANKYSYARVCLEEVGNFFEQDCKSIIHYHQANNLNWDKTSNIRDFLAFIEKQLKLDKKSEVFETNQNTVTAIRVAPFWLENTLKRRLFLILVRDGKQFNKFIGLDSVIKNVKCSSTHIPALINVFLEGYTKFDKTCLDKVYKDFHVGPIAQFAGKTPEQIKDILLFKP